MSRRERLPRPWRRVVVMLAIAVLIVPASARAANPKLVTYRLPFRGLSYPSVGVLEAAGNFRLFLPIYLHGGGPSIETVTDEQTGASSMYPVTPGCAAPTLGINRLFFVDCPAQAPGDGQTGLMTMPLPSGAPVSLGSFSAEPGATGADWAQLTPVGSTVPEFVNLTTGQAVADRTSVGGRLYPDLDSSGLFQTVCRPIRVPSVSPSGSNPAPLPFFSFFGPVAVSQTSADHEAGYIRLQRCGSSRVMRIYTGDNVAHNNKVFVWLHGVHHTSLEISGIVPATERRFTIALGALQSEQLTALAVDDDSVYITTQRDGIYGAALPPALR